MSRSSVRARTRSPARSRSPCRVQRPHRSAALHARHGRHDWLTRANGGAGVHAGARTRGLLWIARRPQRRGRSAGAIRRDHPARPRAGGRAGRLLYGIEAQVSARRARDLAVRRGVARHRRCALGEGPCGDSAELAVAIVPVSDAVAATDRKRRDVAGERVRLADAPRGGAVELHAHPAAHAIARGRAAPRQAAPTAARRSRASAASGRRRAAGPPGCGNGAGSTRVHGHRRVRGDVATAGAPRSTRGSGAASASAARSGSAAAGRFRFARSAPCGAHDGVHPVHHDIVARAPGRPRSSDRSCGEADSDGARHSRGHGAAAFVALTPARGTSVKKYVNPRDAAGRGRGSAKTVASWLPACVT